MSLFKKICDLNKRSGNSSIEDVEMLSSKSDGDNSPKILQDQLLSAMYKKDINQFIEVLTSGKVNPDYYYSDRKDHIQKTCLDIGCSEPGYSEYVQLLLNHGSNINRYNPIMKSVPLFLAVRTGDISTIRVLLSNSKLQVNAVICKKTVLNLAREILNSIEEPQIQNFEFQKYRKIIVMLTKAKAKFYNENMKDSVPKMGISNLLVSTGLNKKIQEDMVALNKCTYREKLLLLLEENEESFINKFEEFVENEELAYKFSLQDEKFELLKIACEKKFNRAVEVIIRHQYSGTLEVSSKRNYRDIGQFAALACRNGDHKILKILLETNTVFTVQNESLLQIAIKSKQKNQHIKSEYDECIRLLLDDERELLNINYLDFLHDTALHHAIRHGDEETTTLLLKKGASINIRNVFDEFPISKMSSECLHLFLNECVKLKTSNNQSQEEDEEIIFDYKFLVPPNCVKSENFVDKPRKESPHLKGSYVPETEVLLYMSEQPRFRKLLGHPVITCFLFLKWQRMRYFHWANTAFYLLFYISIMSQAMLDARSEHIFTIHVITQVLLALLTARELIQFIVFPRSYFFDRGNWLESALIAVSWMAIYGSDDHKRQLLSVAIMLSSMELFSMVGKFPKWSLYVEMLRTVTVNFLKFFLWYSFVIMAFALCFYVLFKSDEEKKKITVLKFNMSREDNTSRTFFSAILQNNGTDDDEVDAFSGPGMSIFKTIIMLASEFDASSIDFDHYPMVSYPMFAIFIFTISIVLLNLLNGLAVSDIQKIAAEAQLWSYVYQVQMISFFERFFLGENKLELRIPGSLEWVHNIVCSLIGKVFFDRFQKSICRFPDHEPNLLISVKSDGSIDMTMNRTKDKENNISNNSCCNKLNVYFTSRFKKLFKSSTKQHILNLTKAIIDEKLKDIDIQEKIKTKIVILEGKLNAILGKVDTIDSSSEKNFHEITKIDQKLDKFENNMRDFQRNMEIMSGNMKYVIDKLNFISDIIENDEVVKS